MNALKKEQRLEELVKNEQIEKLENETKNLITKFKHERKKNKCLQRLLKEREEENEKNRESMEIENEVKKLKESAVTEVKKKRKILKNKLIKIKNKILRKNRFIEQQIQKIRGEMANTLIKANKKWRLENMQESQK